VLARLTARRLITADDGSVTVAHEARIQGWPRLRGWLAEDRDLLRAHRRLTEAATEWDHHGREPSFLCAGARLTWWAGRRRDGLSRCPASSPPRPACGPTTQILGLASA